MNKWKACLELVRLPNLFTAMADIMAGGWIAYVSWQNFQIGALLSLIISSACLYAMGVAFIIWITLSIKWNVPKGRCLPGA
ncbi:hypothetical protein [Paenibacillus tyrfis]|uniref:hypothetical protein n=1 Tax=Paenibacillus tyrfis TaxID=1501230 RepID=UPI00209CBD36|nr:hypothetical protein [Paenibacillus tyrfis]MCP1311526.1 hypothetical protein [Paenibacillus tyrfis]